MNTAIRKTSQELFELAFGYGFDVETWTKEELMACMSEIQEQSTILQQLVGNSTAIQYIGFVKPTEQEAKASALYSQKGEGKG